MNVSISPVRRAPAIRVFGTFLIVAVCLSGTTGLRTTEPTGILSGKIAHPYGKVLPKAAIRVQHWTYDPHQQYPALKEDGIFFSDDAGKYSINLAPEIYDIFISYPNMSPVAKKIKIDAGKETTFNPKMHYDPRAQFVF